MRRSARSKVFCIGAPKTGTSSMRRALEELGYSHKTWDKELWLKYKQGNLNSVFKVAEQFDSFDDGPWNNDDLYKELDSRFPNSKFILTERERESWLRSHEAHFSAVHLRESPTLLWPRRYSEDEKQRVLQNYLNRNQQVKSYFQDRPDDFLVIDVCSGEGWEKLCPFLGYPPRNGPFPRENVTKQRRTTFLVWKSIIGDWRSTLARGLKKRIRSFVH